MHNTESSGSRNKSASKMMTALRIVIAFMIIICYGSAIFFGYRTLDHLMTVWIIAVITGLFTGTFMWQRWRRISSFKSFFPNFIINTAAITGIAAGLIFTLNYTLSRHNTSTQTEAIVIEKYSETKHHSRRVGRRRYVQGTPYQAYYVRIKIPADGSAYTPLNIAPKYLSVNLPLTQYNRVRVGKKIAVKIEKGLFGMPVLKSSIQFQSSSI